MFISKDIINEVLLKKDMEQAAKSICDYIIGYYPDGKINLVKKHSKRIAYIAGSGVENYEKGSGITIDEDYSLVVKNINFDIKIKEEIIDIFKLIIGKFD